MENAKIKHSFLFRLWVSHFIVIPFLLAACSDDSVQDTSTENPIESETPTDIKSFWEQPHVAFLGLKGQVASVTEIMSVPTENDDWEEAPSTWTEFNKAGQIIFYNPTGVEMKRWIGMEMEAFTYNYDEKGRLTEACITNLSEENTTYTITYNDSSYRYVPLPFNVGPMDFFLVKGISGITTGNNDSFNCSISDNSVCYTFSIPVMRDTIVRTLTYYYIPGEAFPASCTSVESYAGEEYVSDSMEYYFAPDGRLLSCTICKYEYGELLETETCLYHPSLLLCVQSSEYSNGDDTHILYNNEYNEQGWLSSSILAQNENTYTETYLYPKIDDQGNWTEGHFTWSSRVDPTHFDGNIRMIRTLQYHD